MNEAINVEISSALKCPYKWSSSAGFLEIFKPISTHTDEITSVALLIPSATKAEDLKNKPAKSFRIVSNKYDKILSLAPCSARFKLSKIELFMAFLLK